MNRPSVDSDTGRETEEVQNLVLLGSTGSIGRQTLEVVRNQTQAVRVVALATHRNIELLAAQAAEFSVRRLAIGDEDMRSSSQLAQLPADAVVGFGPAAVEELAALEEADTVLNALVGAAGLRASHTALVQGKRLALANKESLVVGGEIIMPLVDKGQLLPVDSEHSAIYQCLVGEDSDEVARIWLTASGGPFRDWTRSMLSQATADQALSHPTWSMGPKITIDSATLMNKGLEVIEAHHLFAKSYDEITIVVHPQSCIHSMVEYRDGSVKAHLGATDMRIPIQYALSFPLRWNAPVEPLDFTRLGQLDFAAPDLETFGVLRLALEAGRIGGTAPAALNAANEVAVAAFLASNCAFLNIERVVNEVLDRLDPEHALTLEQLEEVDAWARSQARSLIS